MGASGDVELPPLGKHMPHVQANTSQAAMLPANEILVHS